MQVLLACAAAFNSYTGGERLLLILLWMYGCMFGGAHDRRSQMKKVELNQDNVVLMLDMGVMNTITLQ